MGGGKGCPLRLYASDQGSVVVIWCQGRVPRPGSSATYIPIEQIHSFLQFQFLCVYHGTDTLKVGVRFK